MTWQTQTLAAFLVSIAPEGVDRKKLGEQAQRVSLESPEEKEATDAAREQMREEQRNNPVAGSYEQMMSGLTRMR